MVGRAPWQWPRRVAGPTAAGLLVAAVVGVAPRTAGADTGTFSNTAAIAVPASPNSQGPGLHVGARSRPSER